MGHVFGAAFEVSRTRARWLTVELEHPKFKHRLLPQPYVRCSRTSEQRGHPPHTAQEQRIPRPQNGTPFHRPPPARSTHHRHKSTLLPARRLAVAATAGAQAKNIATSATEKAPPARNDRPLRCLFRLGRCSSENEAAKSSQEST